MRMTCWGAVVTLAAASFASCGSGSPGPHACTEIGCTDQLTVSLHDASGTVPSGMQTVTAVADGATTSCSFTLPLTPANNVSPPCPLALQVLVLPGMTCTTTGTGQYEMQSCVNDPGKLSEQLLIDGKPTMVHLTVTVDGTTWLDDALAPAYAAIQPNGPECGPTCWQATVERVLAAP